MYTPRRKMISPFFAAVAAKLYEVLDKLTKGTPSGEGAPFVILLAIFQQRAKIAALGAKIMLVEGLGVLQHGLGTFDVFGNAVSPDQLPGGDTDGLDKQGEYPVEVVGEAIGALVDKLTYEEL